jgi:hypothetical protein
MAVLRPAPARAIGATSGLERRPARHDMSDPMHPE